MLKKSCLSLLFTLLFATTAIAQGSFTGKAVGISDGDTIQVMHKGKPEKIRLADIDCPEKRQAFGTKAKQFSSRLVGGKVVTVQAKTTDQYGRTVGEVFLPDGRSLNRELVKAGYAWWYRKYSEDASLNGLEAEARESKRGLWSDPHAIPPWEFRRGKKDGIGKQNAGALPALASIPSAAGIYHGNLKSKVFHSPGCRNYGCKNCGVVFSSRDQAISSGYRPCKLCSP